MILFNEIHDAYEQVNFGGENGASAYLNVAENRLVIIPSPVIADDDEIEEAEKQLETGDWIELPDKYELHLGKELVFRFAAHNTPLLPTNFGRTDSPLSMFPTEPVEP